MIIIATIVAGLLITSPVWARYPRDRGAWVYTGISIGVLGLFIAVVSRFDIY